MFLHNDNDNHNDNVDAGRKAERSLLYAEAMLLVFSFDPNIALALNSILKRLEMLPKVEMR